MRNDQYARGTKNFAIALILTLFPYTDMMGVNFFYMGRHKLAWIKIGLLVSFVLCIFEFSLLFLWLPAVILWWLVDIPLVASKKISPRWEDATG